MPAFHKNDTLSRSRQSSVDLPLAECPSLTSVSESLAASQSSDSVYTEGAHSPEGRRRAASSRRSSVFNMRSRSNTVASTASSILSSSHVDMASYDHVSPGSPPALRQVGSHGRLDQSVPRRSIFRGRMGKRLSESIGAGMELDDHHEVDAGRKRASFLRKKKGVDESAVFRMYHNTVSEAQALMQLTEPDLKSRISNPFDFQHLTHADRHQVSALEQAPKSALVDGWAERAARFSAAAAGPPGTISPRNISAENLNVSESGLGIVADLMSPPQSPRLPGGWQHTEPNAGASPSRPGLRLTRSVESFSQPGVNIRAQRHSYSTVAPLRTSSLLPTSAIHDIPEEGSSRHASATSPAARNKRQSGVWDAFPLSATASPDQLPGIEEDFTYVGNAVTTPDDSAIQAMTPPFSPSLEDVAEEPERFVSPRPAPQPPQLRTPTSPKSPFPESFSFNSPRSPGFKSRNRGNSRTSPKSSGLRNFAARPSSQASETLGSPRLARESPIPRPSVTRRKSNTWRAIEESWEDDVDYIYEHALEADCDNDWDCVSEDESFAGRHRALAQAIREDRSAAPQPPHAKDPSVGTKPGFQLQLPFTSSRFKTGNDSMPDLGSTFAASASTTGTGLQTPFHESEGFILSPSLLLPQVYKDAEETSYEEILKDYVSSDCQYPITDLDQSATSSARSSRVRFSRRSSYDSSLMSSAQSSGLWNSPIRRSASSAGSLPELVHSRHTRRNFSLIVDELSEQVASLEAFGSDDEDVDVTPPGPSRPMANRTFFKDTSDNSSHQRNRPYHKHALSEGAAQASTPIELAKSRGRAATASRTDGDEFLHLFPTPPSFSPSNSN